MIDHLTMTVADAKKACAFYTRVLKPLGYRIKMKFENFYGFGDEVKPYFWIKQGRPVSRPQHIAFAAKTRKAVDAFYKAALAEGAKDAGAPGPRPHYHSRYYGAFVIDPNGHPIEACCHR